MKKYSNAELQIVRVNNNDIVTASQIGIGTGTKPGGGACAPDRRSIWD